MLTAIGTLLPGTLFIPGIVFAPLDPLLASSSKLVSDSSPFLCHLFEEIAPTSSGTNGSSWCSEFK